MSRYSGFDLFETSIWKPRALSFFPPPAAMDEFEVEEHLGFALKLINANPRPSSFDLFESARLQEREETELYIRTLSDRVNALELGFDRVFAPKIGDLDRKYKWITEIKGERVDRKYTWRAEAKAGEGKIYTWKAEINGKGGKGKEEKTYTFVASAAPPKEGKGKCVIKEKEKKEKGEKKKKEKGVKLVEIDELDHGAIAIKKALTKYRIKRKRKQLSPQDAAMIIQNSFRGHLIRRSQVLRSFRDLAVAKAKLKEIRALFYNFSYRRQLANDAEERQRFSEKIIVLLLTVDAIEGADYMVRAARRSMIEELESMLEEVEPQAPEKLGSMKGRKFDLPLGGPIPREMATGVAKVVQMLDEEDDI